MAMEFFVLRGGRVAFAPGHYDEEGAEAFVKRESKLHPRATYTIVQVRSKWQGVPK